MTDRRFVLELGDSGYPEQLLDLSSPPKTLYGIGDPELLEPGIAVIGARHATPYGRKVSRLLAATAAAAGVNVVSGAAMGCDQAAQEAAIRAGGRSVAVMGCGADVDYPSGARSLLVALRSDHLVVSENPWGTTPKPYLFARRNRIIAALSACLLVVEAAIRSGTASTAKEALDLQRTILAVPGSVFAPETQGTNRLIVDGAQAVADAQDLHAALNLLGLGSSKGRLRTSESGQPDHEEDSHRTGGAKKTDGMLAACLADPTRPDDLARLFDRDITAILRRLGELETEGLLARYPDGRYGAC